VAADRQFRAAKRSVVDAFERSYLSDLLKRHGGNVTAAAETAGMLRSALQRLLRKHDLRSSSFRGNAHAGTDAS
jgi:DNA-binding NtrC family response regulator